MSGEIQVFVSGAVFGVIMMALGALLGVGVYLFKDKR